MDASHGPPSRHGYPPPTMSVPHMSQTFRPPALPQQLQAPPVPHGQPLPHHPTQSDPTDRARAYKSRNKRPCDFCRYKKAACHLESQPPCELCIRYNKECTFVESPAKRRRPTDVTAEGKLSKPEGTYKHSSNGSIDATTSTPFSASAVMANIDNMPSGLMPWENGLPQFGVANMDMTSSIAPDYGFDSSLYPDPIGFDSYEPMSASTSSTNPPEMRKVPVQHRASMDTTSPQSQTSLLAPNLQLPFESSSGEPSLDRQNSSNSQIVGLSGESDPYLFSKFRYDDNYEASFQSIRVRKMNNGPNGMNRIIPTFFTIQHNALASKAQPQDKSDGIEKWRAQVEEMVSDEVGKRLIQLFYKYIQPYFPVLSRQGSGGRDSDGVCEPQDLSPCVLAAVYGHALPYCAWDERLCVDVYTPPSTDALFKIAWNASLALLHTPNLAVMQALLLLVQRRPTNRHVSDTPFKWVMMGTAVSIAQTLGLNRDPTDWPIPAWEKRHRKRLAWAVYIQDKWLSLNFGRSSHLQADDWDVSPLTEADFPPAERKAGDTGDGGPNLICQHFMKLCELTSIADDICRDLFSVRATRHLQSSLELTLEAAKPLQRRVNEWFNSLPVDLLPLQASSDSALSSSERRRRRLLLHELDGNGSLQLAYITVKIELFRAMLRPQITDANAAAVSKLRAGALIVAREISEFLDHLNARELEAFWASYARTNFTIASSFFVLLFVTSPSVTDAKECLGWLNSWRKMLRIKSRSCDLLSLALLRLDGMFVAGLDQLIELSPAARQAWNEVGMQST